MIPDNLPLTFAEASIEAERITAEAASAVEVDAARRVFDARMQKHLLEYGFDTAVQS